MNGRVAKRLRRKAEENTQGQSAGHTKANYKILKNKYNQIKRGRA